MGDPDIEDLIDFILTDNSTLNNIRIIYQKYKRPDMYFYVPIDVQYRGDKIVKTNMGDKSYSSLEKLIINLKLWFDDEQDIQRFSERIWDNRKNNIVAMILGETSNYNFGCVAIIPMEGEIEIVGDAYIGKFSHIDPSW